MDRRSYLSVVVVVALLLFFPSLAAAVPPPWCTDVVVVDAATNKVKKIAGATVDVTSGCDLSVIDTKTSDTNGRVCFITGAGTPFTVDGPYVLHITPPTGFGAPFFRTVWIPAANNTAPCPTFTPHPTPTKTLHLTITPTPRLTLTPYATSTPHVVEIPTGVPTAPPDCAPRMQVWRFNNDRTNTGEGGSTYDLSNVGGSSFSTTRLEGSHSVSESGGYERCTLATCVDISPPTGSSFSAGCRVRFNSNASTAESIIDTRSAGTSGGFQLQRAVNSSACTGGGCLLLSIGGLTGYTGTAAGNKKLHTAGFNGMTLTYDSIPRRVRGFLNGTMSVTKVMTSSQAYRVSTQTYATFGGPTGALSGQLDECYFDRGFAHTDKQTCRFWRCGVTGSTFCACNSEVPEAYFAPCVVDTDCGGTAVCTLGVCSGLDYGTCAAGSNIGSWCRVSTQSTDCPGSACALCDPGPCNAPCPGPTPGLTGPLSCDGLGGVCGFDIDGVPYCCSTPTPGLTATLTPTPTPTLTPCGNFSDVSNGACHAYDLTESLCPAAYTSGGSGVVSCWWYEGPSTGTCNSSSDGTHTGESCDESDDIPQPTCPPDIGETAGTSSTANTTCIAGACSGGTCAWGFGAGSCSSGHCSNQHPTCTTSGDCVSMGAGTSCTAALFGRCSGSGDCPASCTVDGDCAALGWGTCVGVGVKTCNLGLPCSVGGDCTPLSCTVDRDCAAVSCGHRGYCVGGSNVGGVCQSNSECPGSQCNDNRGHACEGCGTSNASNGHCTNYCASAPTPIPTSTP